MPTGAVGWRRLRMMLHHVTEVPVTKSYLQKFFVTARFGGRELAMDPYTIKEEHDGTRGGPTKGRHVGQTHTFAVRCPTTCVPARLGAAAGGPLQHCGRGCQLAPQDV